MKIKSMRILSIVAVMVLALTVATTAFANTATVSTSTEYIIGAGSATQVKVDTTVSQATPGSKVAYLVTNAPASEDPSSTNIIYLNQYDVDANGDATISYKFDASKLEANNYTTTVKFGSTADVLTDNLNELATYRVINNGDGTITVLPAQNYEIDTITIDGNQVSNSLALTQTASANAEVVVTTKSLESGAVGDDKMASAYMTDNGTDTVNCLLQPVAGSGITEMGICYGNLLFPSKATSIGITNVKLVFEGFPEGYTFATESAKCNPYYKVGDALFVYSGSAFVAE